MYGMANEFNGITLAIDALLIFNGIEMVLKVDHAVHSSRFMLT